MVVGVGRSTGNTRLNNTYKRSIPSQRRLPIPGITVTVDSSSQRPASQPCESPPQLATSDKAVLVPQQASIGFLAAQQADADGSSSSSPPAATIRSNHSGGWTPWAIAQANFFAGVKQPQPDQHDWASRHEQLQSMHGNGMDRSFTTILGIEITKPLANAHTNTIAEMTRRSRIGCRKRRRGNMSRAVSDTAGGRWAAT